MNRYCQNYAMNNSIISSYTRIQNPEKKKPELSFTDAVFLGFTLSQAMKALRESRGIALLHFRPLH